MKTAPKGTKYVVYLDKFGKAIKGWDYESGANLKYDREEKDLGNSIKGAYLYTPNGCCWRLVRGVWKCRPRYCK